MQMDGIHVSLELLDGSPIREFAHPHQPDRLQESEDDERVLRSIISSPRAAPYRVKVEFGPEFKSFSSEGVKLTIACGHTEQDPGSLHDVQAWFVPKEDLSGERVEIDCFDIFGQGGDGIRHCVDMRALVMPGPQR